LKVYYAHGGGYTELGGMREFLLKINGKVPYERIFPAVASKPKRKVARSAENDEKAEIKVKPDDSGITGKGSKGLFKRILKRLKNKKLDREEVRVLVVIDDTDCRLSDKDARQRFLQSVKDFEQRAKEIYEDLEIIFIWIEPEVEKWFCLDVNNCFPRNKPCGDKDFHRKLSELLENYGYEYDSNKDSCKEKFSRRFKVIVEGCGIYREYSKKTDGPLLLAKVDPHVIEAKDPFATKGIKQLKNLKIRR